MRAWPVARSIFDAPLSSQQDCISLALRAPYATGREASCPNFEPRAHARLTGLTRCSLRSYVCRLITYWPARSIFISGAKKFETRIAPVKSYVRDANERTTGWITRTSALASYAPVSARSLHLLRRFAD